MPETKPSTTQNDAVADLIKTQAELVAATQAANLRAERLQTLLTVSQARDLPLKQQIERLLQAVLDTIGADIGIVSKIDPLTDKYTVMYHVAPEGVLHDGQEFQFKRTYCERTLAADDVLAVPHVALSDMKAHPAYQDFQLETYIGVPIMVNEARYGTLNFSSPKPHEDPFNESDRDFIRIMGDWVGRAIERDQAQKQLQAQNVELRKAMAMAKEANRLKGEFLATMSHELRTPLNAIIGFSEIMINGMGGEIDEDAKFMIGRMHDNSARLLNLINDVLDMSKIEARRIDISYESINIASFIKSISAEMAGLVNKSQVNYEATVSLDMPKELLIDDQHLRRVIVNLLSNAFKFTTNGTVSLEVGKFNEDKWTIKVTDTGVGIPEHQQQVIFEPFRQADGSSRRSYAGTGLGLSISQELVRAMEGFISVSSELGKGSTFTVTLPLRTRKEPIFEGVTSEEV